MKKTVSTLFFLAFAAIAQEPVICTLAKRGQMYPVPANAAVLDFSNNLDRDVLDWRDVQKLQVPVTFPAIADRQSGVILYNPSTNYSKATNDLAKLVAASDFGQAESNYVAVLAGRDEDTARKDLRKAIQTANTDVERKKALLDLADYFFAKDQASGGGLKRPRK